MEKVYPYQERKPFVYVAGGIAVSFLFLLFFVMRESMGPAPPLMELVMNLFVVILPIMTILAFLYPFVIYPYTATKEIVFSKESMVFKRGFRPRTIVKITDLNVRKFRGKDTGVIIKGLTPDGKKAREILTRKAGRDINERWEEFKADLQKIKSK